VPFTPKENKSKKMTETCCPKGSWGELLPDPNDEKYIPMGEEIKLRDGELHTYYVSAANESKKVVYIFTDVWGITSRIKSIADKLATSLSCTVVVPDILRGETAANLKSKSDFFVWIKKYPWEPLIVNDLEACTDFLVSKDLFSPSAAESTVGCIGFCWGAWVVAKVLNSSAISPDTTKWGKSVSCGVGLHPSTHVENSVFERDEDKMLQEILSPMLLLPAGNDKPNLKKGHPNVTYLESKGGESIEYPEMVHGWVSRGDLKKENVKRDNKDALEKTTSFLEKTL